MDMDIDWEVIGILGKAFGAICLALALGAFADYRMSINACEVRSEALELPTKYTGGILYGRCYVNPGTGWILEENYGMGTIGK